jgi:uncharacterized protein (DUF1697 family)
LLRGINIGGHKIKMDELRQMCESLGYESVTTYIQSGNIIFQSNKNAEEIGRHIEKEIEVVFGFIVTVVLRTLDDFQQIINNCPYDPNGFKEGESLHVSFLSEAPPAEKVQQLENYDGGVNVFYLNDKALFLYLRQSILHSKLAVQLSKLGVPTTVRNWNTVKKLASLASGI